MSDYTPPPHGSYPLINGKKPYELLQEKLDNQETITPSELANYARKMGIQSICMGFGSASTPKDIESMSQEDIKPLHVKNIIDALKINERFMKKSD